MADEEEAICSPSHAPNIVRGSYCQRLLFNGVIRNSDSFSAIDAFPTLHDKANPIMSKSDCDLEFLSEQFAQFALRTGPALFRLKWP